MERFGFEADREALGDALLRARVSRLLPPALTAPLPYRLDGVPYAGLVARAAGLATSLAALGVCWELGDDSLLIARAAGLSPTELQELERRAFATADADSLRDLAARARLVPQSERARA